MKLATILLAALGTVSLSVRADQTAQEVLEKVHARYEQITDAEIEFTQRTTFVVSGAQQDVTGRLLMKKENKYRMQFEEQTIVTDGTTVWSYSASTHQLLIDNFKLDERALSPERILTAAPGEYTATLVGHEKLGKADVTVLKLVPKGETSPVKSLKLWVSDADWLMKKVEIIDIGGKVTVYTIHSIRVNPGIPDSQFSFQAPEGAEVVDLR